MSRTMLAIVAVLALVSPGLACEAPEGWRAMRTKSGSAIAAAKIESASLKVGQPFVLEVQACLDGRLTVDAVMPAHGHGMNYFPIVMRTGAGSYRAQGMVFHMPGRWEVRVDTYWSGSLSEHRLTLDIE